MKKTRGICYPPLFWCSISNIHNWMFLHVLLAGVWIFMSLQGLVGCLPFVGYNFLGFGSPQPPLKWLHGVDSPGIRTSRRSVSCPRRLRRNTRSRVETSVPGAPGVTVGVFFFFGSGSGCDLVVVGVAWNCCRRLLSPRIFHSIRKLVTSFSSGQNKRKFDLKRQKPHETQM